MDNDDDIDGSAGDVVVVVVVGAVAVVIAVVIALPFLFIFSVLLFMNLREKLLSHHCTTDASCCAMYVCPENKKTRQK